MDQNQHTPEPWTYGEDNDGWYVEKSGRQLAYQVVDEADARRIVACVNACEGIPTETIEAVATDRQFWPIDLQGSSRKGLITMLGIQNFTVQGLKKQVASEARKKLKKQRDELLSAFQGSTD